MNPDTLPSATTPLPTMPSVLIVILNWNSLSETDLAVQAALKTEYPSFSILVIDNGSDPATHAELKGLANERVDVIFLPENRGFTGGSNYGLRAGLERGFEFVWLFNSDASTAPETLASLVETANKHPAAGMISPRIVASQEPTRELFTGGLYEPEIPSVMHTSKAGLIREWVAKFPAQIVLAGTALLVRAELIRTVGYLDETFFAYWEDMDYSVRSLNAGFRNVIDFRSYIMHFDKFCGPPPVSLKPHWRYYMMRNQIFFWRKHAKGKQYLKTMVWAYRDLLRELRTMRHDPEACRALCAGAWDGYLHRTGAYHPGRHMPAPFAGLMSWASRRGTQVP